MAGHKIHFSEKADEIPDGEAGDVVFVLQEQPHAEYKRKGDDLFIERDISLSEALTGFVMDLNHLDGRKLKISSAPGDVIKPVAFDPLSEVGVESLWDTYENSDCPSLDNAAVAETEDLNVCKKAVSKGQLKGKGIGCFVQKQGKTVFKQCSTAQALAAKSPSSGSTLYVLQDPESSKDSRMMKCVKDAGLPRLKAPFENGNLFIKFNIIFPANVSPDVAKQLLPLLGPPKNVSTLSTDDDNVEEVELSDMDPVVSMKDYQPAEEEDDDEGGGAGGQRVQCAQQ